MKENRANTSSRLQRLRRKMDESGLHSLLIIHFPNILYLSGFSGSCGYLLITPKGNFLITDFRYVEQANKESPDFTVVQLQCSISKTVNELLTALKVVNMGFEKDYITYSTYLSLHENLSKEIELIPYTGLVEELRAIKDEDEMLWIREAVSLTDRAFGHILPFIKPGVYESDIALELEYFMRKEGAQRKSFEFIVASGKRSSLPHGIASTKRLAAGELVTLDIGAVYQGYCADLTRTVALGPVGSREKEIYDIVLRAQETAIHGIKPGMSGAEADRIGRSVIDRAGYGKYFGHGLGHGVGLEVHEAPTLSPKGKELLRPGMVVTVEPGIYIPEWGGVRTEDMIYISEEEALVLTGSPKEFIVI